MRLFLWLLPLLPFVTEAANSSGYQYLSPVPASHLVSPWNNIVIRYGGTADAASIRSEFLSVEGSRSGVHAGDLILSDDSRTLVFKPHAPFAPGEHVTVSARAGLYVSDGQEVPPLVFDFHVSALDPRGDLTRSISRQLLLRDLGVEHPTVLGPPPAAVKEAGCDTLPAAYPVITPTTVNNPTPGELFMAPFSGANAFTQGHLNILDERGNPVFYRDIPTGVFDFKVQPTGVATYYRLDRAQYYAIDSSYAVIDSFQMRNGYLSDLHELIVLPNHHSLMMCYDVQVVRMDTVVLGGDTAATVVGLVIQELDSMRNVVFQWRSWDHFSIRDGGVSPLVPLDSNFIDYCHGNSIERGPDGDLIISSRHMNEITKIDIETGDIIWRMGRYALNNQFTFINDTRGFSHQHDARWLPNGNLTLWDNGNYLNPEYSRALEYEIDEQNLTARLVWEYRNTPDMYGAFMGNVQRHPDGGNMMCWGGEVRGDFGPRVTEIHPDGSKAVEFNFTPFTWTYRAFRFPWKTNLMRTSSDTLDFGVVNLGDSSYQAFIVTNNSADPLTINCLSNGDTTFSALATLPITLPPHSSTGVTVKFVPDAIRGYEDRLYIRSVNDTQLVAYPVVLKATTLVASTDDPGTLPDEYRLYQNYPNPFNPATTIRYDLPEDSRVTLAIYDIVGRRVVTLVDSDKPAGHYEAVWNAAGMASGTYFYRLTAGEYTETRRLTIIK